MGLFSRKPGKPPLQVPDELAQQAAAAYGTARFASAAESYATAIDKIHTMCVLAAPSSRIRAPGAQDQPILDGFVSSVGATLAMDPTAGIDSLVERTCAYLRDIADAAGTEANRYLVCASHAESELRRARG